MIKFLSLALFLLVQFVFFSACLPILSQRCTKSNGKPGTCKKFNECPGATFIDVNNCQNSKTGPYVVCCDAVGTKKMRKSAQKCFEYEKETMKETPNYSLAISWSLDESTEISPSYTYDCTRVVGLVIGGQEAEIGEFPHAAALGKKEFGRDVFKCGGSLISEQFILTAAHCEDAGFTFARLGATNLYINSTMDRGRDYKIKEFIRHDNYNSQNEHHDIALIKLFEVVKFTKKIHPACLWQTTNVGVDKAVAIGWGVTELYDTEGSEDLMKVDLFVPPNDQKCHYFMKRKLGQKHTVISGQICANGGVGKDTCGGDSGGPLQIVPTENKCSFHIIGITSYGIQCGLGYPGVYTRVSAYLDWIEDIVWPD